MHTKSGALLSASPLPDDILALYQLLHAAKKEYPSLIIACEKAQTIPGRQSVKGAFTSGRNFGVLQACIRLLYVPAQYIPPVTWQAELHKGADGDGPKEKSLNVAKNLWPCEKFTFHPKQMKPQDGIVDAMLIAEFLRRRLK
jgi:hypothetical protein